jgi:RNA-directed DNA polymerase
MAKDRITNCRNRIDDSMTVEQQSGHDGSGRVTPRAIGPGVTGAECVVGQQSVAVSNVSRDLARTMTLMEMIVERTNLNLAYERVVSNGGAPGVDGMTVSALKSWCRSHGAAMIGRLLDGSYQPHPVRGVQIPKPGGGQRQLGIPTVVDRLVQQAISQILTPLIDPTFSVHSYGFRPGRSAHQAVRAGAAYVAEGRRIVVDIDLAKFFDRVNHDILMARLARHVADKRLLRIVHRFLEAGMMTEGTCVRRSEGTPQGGPLSPLLANLLLDDLDQELERRGHRFCRYADDCNIYVQSQAAGERVLASVTAFLERKLKLQVNREKSAVAPAWERKFLGYRLLPGGRLGLAPSSADRAKDRLCHLTRRNRGRALEEIVGEINRFTVGWLGYFSYAECRSWLRDVDGWLRQKLRCYRLKQAKRTKAIADLLRTLGVPEQSAWATAACSRGWWRTSHTPGAQAAMDQAWFDRLGLVSLMQRHTALNQP